jgi:hypothetical protein
MAGVLARDTRYHTKRSGLSFDGGNIVSDREHVFIGANTIRRNAIDLDVTEAEIVVRFEQELGRAVLVIGPAPQPIAHIDMMLTPLGDRRVAVADPAAGARIAEDALAHDPDSVTAFETWCERHFFGAPSVRQLAGVNGPLTPPAIQGRTGSMIEASRGISPVLDGIARALTAEGYRVERVPFLFGGPEEVPASDDEERMRAGYPMLTYNNVLVETDTAGPRVYLPRYGWPAMDRAAADAWERLGFAPRPIDGLTISAMYGGALRCAVKVLAR